MTFKIAYDRCSCSGTPLTSIPDKRNIRRIANLTASSSLRGPVKGVGVGKRPCLQFSTGFPHPRHTYVIPAYRTQISIQFYVTVVSP